MGQSLLQALREEASGPEGGATTVGAPGAGAGATPATRLVLSGAIASAGSARLGYDAALEGTATGVPVTADPQVGLSGAAVAIDFSLPQSVARNAQACASAGVALLVGTTGFDAAAREALNRAAVTIPVLIAPNTSVGVAVMTHLVRLATQALGAADIEISEAHHRLKRDAPSGTALALGEAVAGARGQTLSEVAVFDRHGQSAPRSSSDIGFAVVRAGDIVGEHTVSFGLPGERLEFTHRATDRMLFARGALAAARWLVGKAPGIYGMDAMLGLKKPGAA
jgi:4-hydroxy-tetrahydrodipicolinate reductase